MQPLALILDDDAEHSAELSKAVARHGFRVERFDSLQAAADFPEDERVSVGFITLHCGEASGLDLISHAALREANEIILMSSVDEPELVNRGIALGATYFFRKPFDPMFINALLEDLAAEEMAAQAETALDHPIDQFGLLRGGSPPMRKLFRIMRKVSGSDTSVLLIGESGTGKELVAQSLHMFSERSHGEFVAMNCAAVPKELFESELFGHEKGAFSGAVRRHRGFFERANGGTLFLDEITEMPIELQAKLLRVLELGQFRRIGGEDDQHSDARIIAATNRDPEEAIAEGELREDLYFRIARFPIRIPPLRDRGSDIRGLTSFFLNELNARNGTAIGISEAALERIDDYAWPGNVRELRSVLEQAYILANEQIEPAHLKGMDATANLDDDYIRVPATATVEEAEKQLILAALETYDGDKQAAADSLGISLKTLYNRLNDYAAGEIGAPDKEG